LSPLTKKNDINRIDDKENIIVKVTFEFALMIVEFAEILEAKHKLVIAKQILNTMGSQQHLI
jgi:hypothetical protein